MNESEDPGLPARPVVGELVTPKEFCRRNHLDRRTVMAWIANDPTFPALRKDPWPGHTQARYLIALDLIPKWVEGRRAREFAEKGERPGD